MELTPGARLGRYVLAEQASQSGVPIQFLATDDGGRDVMIHLFPPYLTQDPGFLDRFTEAFSAVSAWRCPGLLPVEEFATDDGTAFFVTPRVMGSTLIPHLGTPLSLERVLAVVRPVAGVLDAAHARGLVHRDIKPANILLDEVQGPLVAGFGVAAVMEGSRLTQPGVLLATPEYMSPEQATSTDVGAASDRYSLAVVVYEMLVGRPPFSSPTPMSTILQHMHDPVPPPQERNLGIAPHVIPVLYRALAKNPEARYESGADLVEALAGTAHSASIPAVADVVPVHTDVPVSSGTPSRAQQGDRPTVTPLAPIVTTARTDESSGSREAASPTMSPPVAPVPAPGALRSGLGVPPGRITARTFVPILLFVLLAVILLVIVVTRP